MKSKVIITSNDKETITQLTNILNDKEYMVLCEDSKVKSIIQVLDNEADFIILDMEAPNKLDLDIIAILQRVRPRLPVIVLSDDNSVDTFVKLKEFKVFYSAVKPVRDDELELVIERIKSLKNNKDKKSKTAKMWYTLN